MPITGKTLGENLRNINTVIMHAQIGNLVTLSSTMKKDVKMEWVANFVMDGKSMSTINVIIKHSHVRLVDTVLNLMIAPTTTLIKIKGIYIINSLC